MTIQLVGIDFETRSPVDLKVAGVHRYAEDPDTDVWCMAFEAEGGAVEVWQREDIECPPYLLAAAQIALAEAADAFEYASEECDISDGAFGPLPEVSQRYFDARDALTNAGKTLRAHPDYCPHQTGGHDAG